MTSSERRDPRDRRDPLGLREALRAPKNISSPNDAARAYARFIPREELNEVMSRMIAGGDRTRKASLGGVKAAAEIINLMGSSVETAVLDYIREADNDLAQKIMDNMFTFDDLEKIDDKGIQALLKVCRPNRWSSRSRARRPSCATRCCATCRRAPPKRCAKTWRHAGRCGSRTSKPSRRSC